MEITTPNISVPRVPLRIYPIGIAGQKPSFLLHCTDGALFELVRDPRGDRWVPLPAIPQGAQP